MSKQNNNNMLIRCMLLLALPVLVVMGNRAHAQVGYDGGVERTQVSSLSGFTNDDTASVFALSYVKDNNQEISKKIKNIITFSVIEESPSYMTDSFTASVRIRIYYGHQNFLQDSVDTSLTVNYNNIAGARYNPKAYISFDNIEYMQVAILSINAPVIGAFNTRQVLRLENEMRVTRYYQLANGVYPASVSAAPDVSVTGVIPDALNVNWQWPDSAGNNYTQLEWTWLENELQGDYIDANNKFDTALLFKNNATRVDLPLSSVSYSIPLFYDGVGTLFYRLRAMSLTASGTEEVGPWSAVDTFAFGGHNNNLNWQVNTSYAEDGKRKTVIQYYDGSLRSRQTVTKDNTTNTTISAETFYDGQGRAAVQVLPAPGINNIVAYTQNLNRFNGQPVNTDPAKYFDLTPKTAPNDLVPGMNDSSGAAQYYSALNPEINDSINQNIPDADSFPYAVTRYTPDATGRIMYQSGVGAALKMGGGHQTKYYYGTPAQEELDGLFGTEVGDYTHYFENMVEDPNGQMSVSYVDMHGRTIATALAGDAPASLDTLDIDNPADYPNQAGTQINRNLLDSGSNVVKADGSIESVNSILAPGPDSTTFVFNYHFPVNTLQLPTCNGGSPQTFNCIYDLQLSITDQSGYGAPIVWNYNSIDSAGISQTVKLPVGSFSVRKTLTLDQATFQQYDSSYMQPGNGVCSSLQTIIDSVQGVMEAQAGCGSGAGAPAQLTASACLNTLGTSFAAFEQMYADSLGLSSVSLLTTTQVTALHTTYVNDSLNCNNLSTTIDHTLDNIKQEMLADMIPYSGQYAQNPDSVVDQGSMFHDYNIFEPINKYSEYPLYRIPTNGIAASQPGVYYDQLGDTDLTIAPDILDTITDNEYEQLFQYSWATSLLPYHPEYNQLVFAENNLQATYNFRDNFSQVTSYNQAVTAGYTGSITGIDPFFTGPGIADQSKMSNYITNSWQGGASLWQLAYSSAVCNSITDPTALSTCIAGAPKQPPFSSIPSSDTTELNQIWTTFQSLYNVVRDSMVNSYIQKSVPNADTANLVNQGYSLHFVSSNSLLAKQLGQPNFFATTAVSPGPGSLPYEPAIQDSANSVTQGVCLSYVPNWQNELLQCSVLAGMDSAQQATIINQITARMVAVCNQGTDAANPNGSSDIPPGAMPANSYNDTSFEEIVNSVYAANGIGKDQYCNPYVITFPKPYNKGPLFYEATTATVDTCNCKQYAQIVLNAAAAGYNPSVLSSLNQYLLAQYGDTLTPVLYGGLQQCSSLIKRTDTTYFTKYLSATTSVIVEDSITTSPVLYISGDTSTAKLLGAEINANGSYDAYSETFFKFDSISTLPSNAVVLSAHLQLYAAPEGFRPPLYTTAHSESPDGTFPTVQLAVVTDKWNKNSPPDSMYENIGASYPANSDQILTSSFDSISVDITNMVEDWLPAGNNGGIEMGVTYVNGLLTNGEFSPSSGMYVTYATFSSNKDSAIFLRPNLTVNYYTVSQDSGYTPYILSQPQPLPQFLQCGFNLSGTKCYSCSALSVLTTGYKNAFTGTSLASAPDFADSSLDTTAIAGNTVYANYLNYQTGMQYTWMQYAQAIQAAGCNLSTGSASDSTVICPPAGTVTDTSGLNLVAETPCQQTDAQAVAAAQNIYQERVQQILAAFQSLYQNQALDSVKEQFTVLYTPKEYHYTLYYYDEAGNLVKTVPPKGVHPDFTNSVTVEAAKKAGTDVLMPHTYATNYRYNTLNQVVAQTTPDAGTSYFWYDRLGRLVVSQNAQQALSSLYSYTLYDALGRITEVGQKPQTTTITQAISQDTTALKNWLAGTSPKQQITYTVYDTAYSPIYGILLTQQNLRNRVSYSYTKNLETDNLQYAATYYTYDVHGNVDTLLQDYNGLSAMSAAQNRFKTIAYNYDLISGKVNAVDYEPGRPDAFHHRYNYDAENRLTDVYTSRDSIVWQRDATYNYYKHGPLARTVIGQLQVQGIDYSYTLQGWLKGINQVFGGSKAIANGNGCIAGTGIDNLVVNYRTGNQPDEYTARRSIRFAAGFAGGSSDYFYTDLDSTLQPCQLTNPSTQGSDLAFASELPPVANDAYGISLHYYPGDYTSIAGMAGTGILGAISDAAPLYNGNIAAMAVNIPKLGNPLVYNYHYDQLNRITRMDTYNGLNPVAGTFTPIPINDYKERLNYDPNGNIMGYLRNGAGAINIGLDSLHYNYNTGTNQLDHVNDSVPNTNYTEDIDNQNTANYKYDAIGNLISDVQGGIDSVYWTVYGKISRIKKSSGTVITYTYDATGNRISKAVTPASGVADTTCYVRDADGNVMSIYEKTDSLRQMEVDLYGSSRLGIIKTNLNVENQHPAIPTITLATGYGNAIIDTFTRGTKLFELTNHLGNVLATVSDRKLAVDSNNDGQVDYYNADIISAEDYSSFGAEMPGRIDSSFKYRYGFNDQEKSDEVEPNTTTAEFWEYDSRLGRRWNLDPVINESLSPYATFDNSPIVLSDVNGDDPDGDPCVAPTAGGETSGSTTATIAGGGVTTDGGGGPGDGYTTTTQTSTIHGGPGTNPGSMTVTIQSPSQASGTSNATVDGQGNNATPAANNKASTLSKVTSSVSKVINNVADFTNQQVVPRIAGGLQAVAGEAIMWVGAATSEVGVGAPIFAFGVDYGAAGVNQAIYGKPAPTVTQQTLQELNVPENEANAYVNTGAFFFSLIPMLEQPNALGIDAGVENTAAIVLTKSERLAMFREKLLAAPAAKNPEEAINIINTTLDGVEDAFSGIIKNPNASAGANDGRMYGILDKKYVTTHADGSITALTKGQRIEIQANGHFTIINRSNGSIFLRK